MMEVGNSNNAIQRNALIFPADGTTVRLVSYSIKQKSKGDGSVDFYDYLPDLRPWLETAFPERDFAKFHVDNSPSMEWLQSGNPDTWGNYCLYYTTSSKLPVNQACKDVIKSDPPTGRLFFRGDVFLVKHKGNLGLGHEYIDTPQTMRDITAKFIKHMYENESLEKKLESDRVYEREWAKHKLRYPDIYSAIETGAIERLRTRQMKEDDLPRIVALERYSVILPDGSSKHLLG
ncbi:hypothetical protein V496_00435 [Pseudogymnoascus sp. VKM F-4515 (FW-2607)]|nr:hypothetical protein V496_00435 [Pseudogymnoascus sp. VKM F-4515 (FW-2607)]